MTSSDARTMTDESDLEPQPSAKEDPLVGMQEETDSPREAAATPNDEVTLHHDPHGKAVKSRWLAGALGVFLGGLGAHRLYLGYHRIAMVQIAVTLGALASVVIVGLAFTQMSWAEIALTASGACMLGVLWGLYEGVAIFIGGLDRDAHGRPLYGEKRWSPLY